MTKNESFKRTVRERMAKTGERYAAARAALLARRDPAARRWVSEPEMSDEAVRTATGRGWDEWCDVIDGFPTSVAGHTAIAARLRDELGVDAWWSQTVTVGYERITGLRLPGQMADGSFSANKTRTISVDAGWLRDALLGDDRVDLFGGRASELRSRPTAKAIRLAIGPGVAVISFAPAAGGRTKVAVQHNGLPAFDDVEEWKFFWNEWLDALETG